MQRFARLISGFALGVLLLACAIGELAPEASAQSGDGWTMLIDDKTMGDWNKVGETTWRLEDGAVIADKKSSQDPAYLVSKGPFKDFQLHVEFWASDDANSGVFLRCQDASKIGDRSCYEVNIFDQRKDPTYGTGGIVNFSEVNPMPKAGGKWNTFEITAKGRQITVLLNGQKTVELHNGLFVEGPLALQHGAGVIKFRKVAIKPL
jgi:3-keto-disaccharide hydrolase